MSAKGDNNFLGGFQNGDARNGLNKRGSFPQYAQNGRDDSGRGLMHGIRKLQQRFADSCCSSAENMPPSVFLGLIILLVVLLALLIAGATVWALSKPQMRLMENVSDYDESDDGDDDYDLAEESSSLFDLFTEKKPISKDLHICKGHEFLCHSEEKRIGQLQRCDGFEDCSDGSDEDDCKECKTAFKCRTTSSDGTYFRCLRGDKLCDGVRDCESGEDERNCDGACKEDEYLCHETSKCIPKSYKCDGDPHCPHHDDENECPGVCNNGAIWCQNSGTCIPIWKRCDGVWDCIFGEDEMNCSCKECCGSNRLLCAGSKLCISRSKMCDGKHDCADGADEENCPGICKPSKLETIDTVVCADGRRYSTKLACSGMLKTCKSSCKKCNEVHAFTCKRDGHVDCILKSEVCDGKYDCDDKSDETNCSVELTRRCVRTGFSVRPKWLKEEQFCDGVYDCMDKDDEQNCKQCGNNGVYCLDSRRCITEFERCNGIIDCLDGSDEVGCTCDDCAYRYPPMFKCANSDQCVKFEEACSLCRNKTSREEAFCKLRESL